MNIHSRVFLGAALLIVALAACTDDDDPVGGGPNDDTPPVAASVTTIDAYHFDVTFNERVTTVTANDKDNYTLIEAGTPIARASAAAPGDPYAVAGATLLGNEMTVRIATEESMNGLNFSLTVHGVSDITGNVIGEEGSETLFIGSNAPDNTAPTVVSHTPASNASNVVINPTIVVIFSEPIEDATTSWSSTGGEVAYTAVIDGTKLTLTPKDVLGYYVTYTVNVRGTDFAGNLQLAATEWTFTTRYNN